LDAGIRPINKEPRPVFDEAEYANEELIGRAGRHLKVTVPLLQWVNYQKGENDGKHEKKQ